MYFRLIIIFVYTIFTFNYANSQIKNCECKYYSNICSNEYYIKRDSLINVLSEKYDSVVIFGMNSIDRKMLLIFSYLNGEIYKYKYRIGADKSLSNFNDSLNLASGLLNTLYKNNEFHKEISKIPFIVSTPDLGFTVTIRDHNKTEDFLICYNQVYTIRDKPMGKMFINLMKTFSDIYSAEYSNRKSPPAIRSVE